MLALIDKAKPLSSLVGSIFRDVEYANDSGRRPAETE